jgi:hypothetical protein
LCTPHRETYDINARRQSRKAAPHLGFLGIDEFPRTFAPYSAYMQEHFLKDSSPAIRARKGTETDRRTREATPRGPQPAPMSFWLLRERSKAMPTCVQKVARMRMVGIVASRCRTHRVRDGRSRPILGHRDYFRPSVEKLR